MPNQEALKNRNSPESLSGEQKEATKLFAKVIELYRVFTHAEMNENPNILHGQYLWLFFVGVLVIIASMGIVISGGASLGDPNAQALMNDISRVIPHRSAPENSSQGGSTQQTIEITIPPLHLNEISSLPAGLNVATSGDCTGVVEGSTLSVQFSGVVKESTTTGIVGLRNGDCVVFPLKTFRVIETQPQPTVDTSQNYQPEAPVVSQDTQSPQGASAPNVTTSQYESNASDGFTLGKTKEVIALNKWQDGTTVTLEIFPDRIRGVRSCLTEAERDSGVISGKVVGSYLNGNQRFAFATGSCAGQDILNYTIRGVR
ncbi:hypothetical protein KA082_01530 [Candidatus Woesebacteria bacterium]|nr:hypothetical protein [Candidatus Woesebacteria bacterium]